MENDNKNAVVRLERLKVSIRDTRCPEANRRQSNLPELWNRLDL